MEGPLDSFLQVTQGLVQKCLALPSPKTVICLVVSGVMQSRQGRTISIMTFHIFGNNGAVDLASRR